MRSRSYLLLLLLSLGFWYDAGAERTFCFLGVKSRNDRECWSKQVRINAAKKKEYNRVLMEGWAMENVKSE